MKGKRPQPQLNSLDQIFWTTLRRFWSRWTDVLVVMRPENVIGWHRAGFRFYWRWRFQPHGGRPKITEEIRALIRRLAEENPDWGAPKIHGELLKLGLVLSERGVARYLQRVGRPGDPGKRWLAFLRNHREVIVAFDFFTVPTVTFQLLYCFFVVAHGRRRILHFNVTRHPSAASTADLPAAAQRTGSLYKPSGHSRPYLARDRRRPSPAVRRPPPARGWPRPQSTAFSRLPFLACQRNSRGANSCRSRRQVSHSWAVPGDSQ